MTFSVGLKKNSIKKYRGGLFMNLMGYIKTWPKWACNKISVKIWYKLTRIEIGTIMNSWGALSQNNQYIHVSDFLQW